MSEESLHRLPPPDMFHHRQTIENKPCTRDHEFTFDPSEKVMEAFRVSETRNLPHPRGSSIIEVVEDQFSLSPSQRTLVESIFRELGYEVSTTAFQNLLSFKLKRMEKPALEPIPRKIILQNLVDAMSANSAEEAFSLVKDQFDEMFPVEYPWTVREVSERLMDMYRDLDIEVEIEYFEGGFTLSTKLAPTTSW